MYEISVSSHGVHKSSAVNYHGFTAKPPGAFEVPIITAIAVGGKGGLYEKLRNQTADKGVEPFSHGSRPCVSTGSLIRYFIVDL